MLGEPCNIPSEMSLIFFQTVSFSKLNLGSKLFCVWTYLLAKSFTRDTGSYRCIHLISAKAGYGRRQAAELLLSKGSRIDVRNTDKQTPAGVAQLNRELQMVSFLAERSEAEGGSKFL